MAADVKVGTVHKTDRSKDDLSINDRDTSCRSVPAWAILEQRERPKLANAADRKELPSTYVGCAAPPCFPVNF